MIVSPFKVHILFLMLCLPIQYVSFYTGYLFTVLSLIIFVLLSWLGHTFMGPILAYFPAHESSGKAYRNTIVKFTSLVIGLVYPGIMLQRMVHYDVIFLFNLAIIFFKILIVIKFCVIYVFLTFSRFVACS